MPICDPVYLCTAASHLCGAPVRLYEDGQVRFFHSLVRFPADPFSLVAKETLDEEGHIGHHLGADGCFYGILRFDESRIVIGPIWQGPTVGDRLRAIADELRLPADEYPDFETAMRSVADIPFTTVLETLLLLNHFLNGGEKLSFLDVALPFFPVDEERVDAPLFEPFGTAHNAMDSEEIILSAVRNGDVDALRRELNNASGLRMGSIGFRDLRSGKNMLLVEVALVSREAIHAGMSAEEALALFDYYLRAGEQASTLGAVTDLAYRLLLDYAERMRRYRCGKDEPGIVRDVLLYIREHLGEPIQAASIAKGLSRGRSRLSTDFKKAAGITLSECIRREKIEEAKRLLRYSERTAADISSALGFSSPSHFSRVFKTATGKNPYEYRHQRERK